MQVYFFLLEGINYFFIFGKRKFQKKKEKDFDDSRYPKWAGLCTKTVFYFPSDKDKKSYSL